MNGIRRPIRFSLPSTVLDHFSSRISWNVFSVFKLFTPLTKDRLDQFTGLYARSEGGVILHAQVVGYLYGRCLLTLYQSICAGTVLAMQATRSANPLMSTQPNARPSLSCTSGVPTWVRGSSWFARLGVNRE